MMRVLAVLAVPAAMLGILLPFSMLSAQPRLPAGWRSQAVATPSDSQTFEVIDLPAGEFVAVRRGPRAGLNGKSIDAWLSKAAASDATPTGMWSTALVVQARTDGIASATRQFRSASGQTGAAVYIATAADHRQARLLRMIISSVPTGRGPQGTAAKELMQSLIEAEVVAARQGQENVAATADGDRRSDTPMREASAPLSGVSGLNADARTRAKAEAERYKFVTAPGAGIQLPEIETVFYAWKQVYEIGGLQMKESVYLLLKDGTVHNGLPVPPRDMDMRASRQLEPTTWGHWRKQNGQYAVAWPDAPATFSVPQGNPVVAGRDGQMLQGEFEDASSYEIPGGAGVWSKYSVSLTSEGRFETSRSGGGGMSVVGGATTAMVSDDAGAASSASSPVFAGGSRRRTPDTGDRRGTYRIDGYSVVLRFENGRVERRPFFIDGANVTGVWMLNSLLMKKK